MTIIDGKKIAREILAEQKKIIDQNKLKPKLIAILIGDDEPSKIYINEKCKKAIKIGIDFQNFDLPADIRQITVINLIKKFNNDKTVSGIIIQFPLPKNFDAEAIVRKIDPKKDADGFHQKNIKKFLRLDNLNDLLHKNLLLPATPTAIMEILNRTVKGSEPIQKGFEPFCNPLQTILIGKPSIFTKPLIHYFKKMRSSPASHNFSIISPEDPRLAEKSSRADIVITACGRPKFIKQGMIKENAIVIDIGISKVNGKVAGDVDFDGVAPKTYAITPVTGGVGPVTVAVLLRNVVYSALSLKTLE